MSLGNLIDRTAAMWLAVLILAGSLSLSGCVRMEVLPTPQKNLTLPQSKPRPVDDLEVPHEKDPTKTYRVGPRDVLRVDVRNDPSFNVPVGYTVGEEGNIFLPIVGTVQVANMTTAEIEQKLNELLSQYLRKPDAKVGVQDYKSKIVYVVGQVMAPGAIIMRADMLTLQEAVFIAGLPTPDAALTRTRVITADMEHPITRQINLTDILYKGRMKENILLKPNDIVYVPAKYSANLTAAIADLIRPADQIASFQYRASFSGWSNGSNNSDGNRGFYNFGR